MSASAESSRTLAIESLLGSKAETRYQNIFSTRHLGRTLDFIVHQSAPIFKASKDPAALEYRYREALQLSIFFAWTEYHVKGKGKDKNKSVQIEFGWDSNRAVIAVSFFPADDRVNEYRTLVGKPSTDDHLGKMLMHLNHLTDGTVIRHDKASGMVQICIFLNTGADAVVGPIDAKFEDLVTTAGSGESQNAATVPSPLYQGELQNFQASEKKELPPEDVKIAATTPEAPAIMKVMSNPLGALMNSLKKVKYLASAVSAVDKEEEPKSQTDTSEPVMKKEQAKELYDVKDEMIRDNVDGAFTAIEREIAAAAPNLSKEDHDRICSEIRQSLMKNFSDVVDELLRMQGIKSLAREKHFKETLSKLHERIELLKSERTYNKPAVLMAPTGATTETPEPAPSMIGPNGDIDLHGSERAFSSVLDRFKDGLNKDDSDSVRKQFVQGFMEEMMRDRASLNQSIRDFETSVRKKEHDFKTKLGKLEDKVKRLQAESDQKETALTKMRDTLNKKMQTLVQERSNSMDKSEFDRKVEEFRKSLQVAQEKNQRLEERAAEFQRKLTDEAKTRVASQQDTSKYKQAADLWQRKAAELETQLLAKADGKGGETKGPAEEAPVREVTKKAPAATGDPQLKHKLDQANKLVRSLKEELARSRKKFDELKLEETNLKVQLSKLQTLGKK